MLEAGFTYLNVEGAFYTHTHVDHVGDLGPFLFTCKYEANPRTIPLIISGPKGFSGFFSRLRSLYGDQMDSEKYKLTLKELHDSQLQLDNFKLVTLPLVHMLPCVGYRIETNDGKVAVYSGDTGYCENIIKLSRNADVLVLENALPQHHTLDGHLTPRDAGKIAREAGVKRLFLDHIYPICDQYDILEECAKEFSGPIELAHDLIKITV
ncbi:MAG: MBL fold metallo-hydrolase [Planctomycetota bacterium]